MTIIQTKKDEEFLRQLKAEGVDAETALSRLAAVKQATIMTEQEATPNVPPTTTTWHNAANDPKAQEIANQYLSKSTYDPLGFQKVAQTGVEMFKPIAKTAGMLGVGFGQSAEQVPNFVKGLGTGNWNDFAQKGAEQREKPLNVPWLGNIDPQNNPKNTAGTALEFAGTVMPYTSVGKGVSTLGVAAKQGGLGFLRGTGKGLQDPEGTTGDALWQGVQEGAVAGALAGVFDYLGKKSISKKKAALKLKMYKEAKGKVTTNDLGAAPLAPGEAPVTTTREVVEDLRDSVRTVHKNLSKEYTQMVDDYIKPIETRVDASGLYDDAVKTMSERANLEQYVDDLGKVQYSWDNVPDDALPNDLKKVLGILERNQNPTPGQLLNVKQQLGAFYTSGTHRNFDAIVTNLKNNVDDLLKANLDDAARQAYIDINSKYKVVSMLNNAEKALSSPRSAENWARLLFRKGKVLQKEILAYLPVDQRISSLALAEAQDLALKSGLEQEVTGIAKGSLNSLGRMLGKANMYTSGTVGQVIPSIPYNLGTNAAQYLPPAITTLLRKNQ